MPEYVIEYVAREVRIAFNVKAKDPTAAEQLAHKHIKNLPSAKDERLPLALGDYLGVNVEGGWALHSVALAAAPAHPKKRDKGKS